MTLVHADQIDREAVLRSLNLNVRDPKVQAALLICDRYGLDPVLKHVVLISGNVYVTRDGLLAIAHRSDRLNGIRVDEETETDDEWQAKVTVFVKGQDHGYTYRGRYPKSGQQKKYGPEMAVKVAEVMALRRAFGVTGLPTVEEQWDKSDAAAVSRPAPPLPHEIEAGEGPVPPGSRAGAPALPRPVSSGGERPVPPPVALPSDVDVTGGGGSPGGDPVDRGGSAGSIPAHDPAPSGDVPADAYAEIDPRGFAGANRKARAIAKTALSDDKDDAKAQWEALVWAISSGTQTESKLLTRPQHTELVARLQALSAGTSRLVETDDPRFLGWTVVTP